MNCPLCFPRFAFVAALTTATLALASPPALRAQSMASTVAAAQSPNWIPMPLRSPTNVAAGTNGGEGAQWPRGPIAVSPADPNFLLLPIDVGGLYRSLDGGATWNVAMVGWSARGANGFAIDPRNAQRVLGVAANSMNWDKNWGASPNGLYLSTDKAGSWKQVLPRLEGFAGAVAYDPTSFDAARGYCARVYYGGYGIPLHRSDDGGATWTQVSLAIVSAPNRDWMHGPNGPGFLRVDGKGAIYTAGTEGAFRSDDQGATWTKIRDGETDGLDVAPNGDLYACGYDGVTVSHDRGATWTLLPGKGLEARVKGSVNGIVVSPADSKRMLCWLVPVQNDGGGGFDWPRYVSGDGGATWTRCGLDSALAPLPANGRQGYPTWNPKDTNVAWGIGGDWATKSTDGGRTFHWSNSGNGGIMVGGMFAFNARDPKTVFLGFQDYNGAFTTDGGATWNYRDVSGMGWGGQEYGAFALSPQVMWAGDAGTSWTAPRHLRLTRDGGKTWALVNGADGKPLQWAGSDISAGDPTDANVGFASNFRTADRGATWAAMDASSAAGAASSVGCDGVYAASPTTHTLYGRKGSTVVRSADHGATWQTVADVPGGFQDLAVDGATGRIYVASEDRLKVWQTGGQGGTPAAWMAIDTPADQFGNRRVWTVATDPKEPSIIYVGGPRNTYANAATVCRSTDAGKTWRNLTVAAPLRPGQSGGPHEVSAIRVNPITREAWVAGQCFGLWRIAPPATSAKSVAAAARR